VALGQQPSGNDHRPVEQEVGMRVIVAVDGSAGSRLGLDLIKDAGLPRDTGFRVVAVADGAPGGSAIAMQAYAVGSPYATDPRPTELLTSLEAAKSVLEGAGYVEVDSILLEGRAARAIVEEARAFGADLIVVGHRGRGALTSRLLGSTSAEVIEHAGCAVLVARSSHLGPIMVATDGSEASRTSAELLSGWPLFERFPVTVVSVADVRMPVAIEFQAGVYEQIMKSYLESVEAARTECASRAESAAGVLRAAGRATATEVLEGDPATAIVEAASAKKTDLIVVGTRGLTGLAQIALGSTARKVMLHALCSVLVVPVRPTGPVGPETA
jgi:nucleotide-binding universal stress UspA family protein